MEKNRNTILFWILTGLILIGWAVVMQYTHPRPQPAAPGDAGQVAQKEPEKQEAAKPEKPEKPEPQKPAEAKPREPAPQAEPEPPAPPAATFTLGNAIADFFTAELDSRGASVRSLKFRDFQAADADGRPVRNNGQPEPLELIQADENQAEGSFLLYDAPANGDRPYSRLGKRSWKVDDVHRRDDGTVDRVTFSTVISGVRVSKIYSLNPGDYHLGLEVKLQNTTDHDIQFRYHLTGAHGMPIEGKWYTTVLRNAVVGRVAPNDTVDRNLQDLRRISYKAGGDEVDAEASALQYAGTTTQFFSSLVVVSAEDLQKKFLAYARPTIESAVLRGRITDARNPDRVEVTAADGTRFTVYVPKTAERVPDGPLQVGDVAVVYRTDDRDRMEALRVYQGREADRLLFDDITVHVVSDKIELKAHGDATEHHYLLYNGPAKVMLLGFQEGDQAVRPELVTLYEQKLHLNTVTDFHSPGAWGEFWSGIGVTSLLIYCTNVMHHVLWLLHVCTRWIPGHQGLTILLLTVMVRGLMFPLSRRQAMNMVKMQSLAPEMKALQEKHKDDPTAKTQAMMELYRKHGMGPLGPVGGCWTIFLQMPIFLGLYYALQESIRFRLAPFLWIQNLAAPDMLLGWGSSIPWISDPASYGTMVYLGPYFNLLPVVVAGIMLMQQKVMTPPPTDEQQEMQQKMMKFMTVFFALMFYKVAAGLCLYFITSSLWGFAERKLLPKRKTTGTTPPPAPASNGLFQKAVNRLQSLTAPRADAAGTIMTAPDTAVQASLPASAETGKRGKKARRRERERRRNESAGGNGAETVEGDGSWWADTRRRVQAWWQQVLREARKK